MKVNIKNYNRKKPSVRVDVRIDNFDTWSLDMTLASIILPALIQLRQTKHGVPSEFATVGGEDYDDQYSFDFYKESVDEAFEIGCIRWDDIMDKMIWSFHEILADNTMDKYHHDTSTMWETKQIEDQDLYEVIRDGKSWIDLDGLKLHEARIQEGLELFGKFFRNLWD